MNFFKRKDAFPKQPESVVVSDSSEAVSSGPNMTSPPEPGKWSGARVASDASDAFDEARTSLTAPDGLVREPRPNKVDDTPDVGDERPAAVGMDAADDGERPNPVEARLARLRRQLQDGPRLVSDPPAEVEAEAHPAEKAELPEPLVEPVREVMPDTVQEADLDLGHLVPAQRQARAVAAEDTAPSIAADAEAAMPPMPNMPQPSIAPAGQRAGRVKTRLLGFERSASSSNDPLGAAAQEGTPGRFPVGWIVVVKGPGRGASFCLYNGLSQIGRGSDQTVCLDFGDTSISRQNHAVVAYDPEQKKHFLGHGGKANIVRLNDMPVLSTEELSHGDQIRIGETTLRFVALCGADFDWSMTATDDDFDAAVI